MMAGKCIMAALLIASVVLIPACGGGGTSTTRQPAGNPPPAIPLTIEPATLPPANLGVAYSFTAFSVQGGGTPPFTFSITGSLPPGLTFTSLVNPNTASIEGTATATGTFNFAVNVTDSNNRRGSRAYSLVVGSTFRILTSVMPTAVMNRSYDQAIQTVNGSAPFTWSIVSGQLPTGFTLDPVSGHVQGTPTFAGGTIFEVQATDSSNPPLTARATITLNFVLPLTFVNTQLAASRGVSGTITFATFGGVDPVSKSLVSGSVPGMSMVDGELTGAPTQNGNFVVTIQAQDSYIQGPDIITHDFTIAVSEPRPVILTTSLPAATVGRPYDFTLAVRGGLAPLTWSNNSQMPDGLTLDPTTGRISGTPTMPGSWGMDFVVRDSTVPVQIGIASLTLDIRANPLGRNDSIATATPIQGSFVEIYASLSPYANASGNTAPDSDYYVATANGSALVTIDVNANSSPSGLSPIDPVLEIVNASGQRLTTCRNNGNDDGVTGASDPTPTAFDDTCLNDDKVLGADTDSRLELLLPAGSPQTFYIHVLDFRGDARPDITYRLAVNGIN